MVFMGEIYVGGDLDFALAKLKRYYQKEISRSIASHIFFEARGVRNRRKRLKSIQRMKKLEARSITRTTEARRRFSHDERAF